MYIDSVNGCKLKGRLKMTLKIFKRDDSGMLRIFASPDEVRKPGECFEITDDLLVNPTYRLVSITFIALR